MAYGNYMGSSDVLNCPSRKYDRGQQMRVRDLLNQLALIKQLKEERAERKREWGFIEGAQLEE